MVGSLFKSLVGGAFLDGVVERFAESSNSFLGVVFAMGMMVMSSVAGCSSVFKACYVCYSFLWCFLLQVHVGGFLLHLLSISKPWMGMLVSVLPLVFFVLFCYDVDLV